MLSNLAETLHSSAKSKNKQVAKIWGLQLKKQRFGATICFPEGLENSPFKPQTVLNKYFWPLKSGFKIYRRGIMVQVLYLYLSKSCRLMFAQQQQKQVGWENAVMKCVHSILCEIG